MKRTHREIKSRAVLLFGLLGLLSMPAWLGCSSGSPSSAASMMQTYYVDAVNGNDANSGSVSAPWQTLAKVGSGSYGASTGIYLKRGCTWNEQLTLPASNMVVDAYGSGNAPVINGSSTLSGWTSLGSGIYSASVSLASGEALGNIAENGTMMSFIPWNSDVSTTFTGATIGSYSYNYANSTMYIYPSTLPTNNVYTISRKVYGISVNSLSNILIQNIAITRFSLHGISLIDCNDCTVNTVTISDGGGAVIGTNSSAPPTYLYAGNGIEFDNNSTQGWVKNVTISDIFDSGISPQTYASNSSLSNMAFQDSTVDSCGFAGVEISLLSNNGTTGSKISGVSVSGLTITNSGHGFSGQRYGTEAEGVRIEADNGAGTMSNINVLSTSVSGSAGDGIKLAGEIGLVSLSQLKLNGNHYGINVTEPTAVTLQMNLSSSLIYGNNSYGIYYNSPTAAGFAVYQNTFYNNTGIQFAIFNQAGQAYIENNIFSSSAASTDIFVNSILSSAILNFNCYANYTNMFGYNSSAYSTLAAFNSALGFEANGYAGTVTNQALNNPSLGDFSLQASSSCAASGTSGLGVATDYLGHAFASPPSSGALQYQ